MKLIFSFPIVLLNRLSYPRKFALLWLVSLIAIGVLVYGLFIGMERVIQPSLRVLQGLPLIESVSRSVQYLQQHRGFSAALISGEEAVRDRLSVAADQVVEALQAIEDTLPSGLTSAEHFRRITADWAVLREAGLRWSMAENFAAHTRLIEQIRIFESLLADEYSFTQDTELNTFYLTDAIINKLPYMLESLGQLRARGAGVLADQQLSESHKAQLYGLLGKFDSAQQQLKISLERTVHYNPALREPLRNAYDDIVAFARQITGFVQTDILNGVYDTPPVVFLNMATDEIDKSYMKIHQTLLPVIRKLIETRIAEAKSELVQTISIALLLFLLVVYISICIYYAIVGNIQSLVRAAHTFADGDLSQRINLNTRDELGLIGDSFNRMADGFNAILEARNQVEDKLVVAKGKFQSLVESSSDWIWELDANTNYIYASPKVKELLGYEVDEVIGKSPLDLMPLEEREKFGRFFEDVIQDKKSFAAVENSHLHKDGHIVFLETSGVPVLDEANNLNGYRGIDRDITQRKRDQMQLEASHKKFQDVFDSTSDGMFILDLQGNFIDVNRTAYERLGYTKDELLAINVAALDTHEYAVMVPERMAQIMRHGRATFESAHYCKDGTVMPVEVSARIINLQNKQVILSAIRDITERKQTEAELIALNASLEARVEQRTRELKQARDQADAASRAKSEFLSNMSHEIRSPLAAVIGFSESLQTDNFTPQERDKMISIIVRNGRHLLQVVNDILDLSKIEAGHLEIENIETPIFLLLGEVDSLLGMKARDRGLKFKITYHFPLPQTIVTDPVRLKQILINLCSNAIKFTDEGQITIDVSCNNNFRDITFVVADSGIGMTAEVIERVFEPFAQADSSITRKYGGTGLGLPISRKLAMALDGSLECESHPGQGSRFMLTIANQNTQNIIKIDSLENVATYYESQFDQAEIKPLLGHILLAEDSQDNQQLVAMYIRKTGAQLTIAENGKEAIEKVQAQDFDLILMDMQMPVMDGLTAIRELRAAGYSRPIVSLTANAMLSDREKCESAGADGYLIKPIVQSQFYQTLNRYLTVDTDSLKAKTSRKLQTDMQDSSQYKAIVERFLGRLPQMLDEISTAFAEKNWEVLQVKSHDLKGMGGAMGYPAVTEKAEVINTLVKQGDYEQLPQAWEQLDTLCRSIIKTGNGTES